VIINNQNVNNNILVTQIIEQQLQIQPVIENTNQQIELTPVPSGPILTASPNDNFQVVDEARNVSYYTPGSPYTGNVVGVENQYINLNPTNLNVTAITPNAFIRSGPGNDTLAAFAGRNVLYAGAGSNVSVGSPGTDTFLANVSPAATQNTQPITDLIKNFGAGDDAVIRGLSASDFSLEFLDANGAFGPELRIQASSNIPGGPTATVALPGYTTGDLVSNRLSISFSIDQSTNTPYMLIHANS